MFMCFFSGFEAIFTYGGGTVSKKDQTKFPDGGSCKQKRPNLISGRGETVSKKRPNLISTVSHKDQTEFQP